MIHATNLRGTPAPAASALTLLAGLGMGTTVMTLRGEIAVEALLAGDRIVTRHNGAVPLCAVESRGARVSAVRIRAGSLGHRRPDRDLVMGPGTLVHLRDWRAGAIFGAPQVLIEAHRLVDGEFVTRERPRGMILHSLVFDEPQVVYADGVEVGA